MDKPEWPDFLDIETGIFTYYGDNKLLANQFGYVKKEIRPRKSFNWYMGR